MNMKKNLQKTKILYLHTGAELYGADQILLTIVSNLDKDVFEPIVLLPNDGPLVKELKKHNIRVEITSYPIIRRKYFNIKGIISLFRQYFSSCKKIKKIVDEEKIDIIHSNTIAVLEGIYLKKRCKVKLISHVHEMLDKPKLISKFLYKINLKYCDKMIVVSNAVKNHIEKNLNFTSDKIKVIHNGIPQIARDDSYRNIVLKEFNMPNDSYIVAIVGRINAIKGQDHFIEALKKVISKNKKVYGLIIGDSFEGQEWRVDELKEIIRRYNLEKNIIYCGFRNDIKKMYNAFDLLVLSSVQNDSFPTVVLEAMSCGVPCVAYKCGGVEEMIDDGVNGYLVEQGNVEQLSDGIEKILSSKKILQSMKKNSIKLYTDNYQVSSFIKKVMEIYKNYMIQ